MPRIQIFQDAGSVAEEAARAFITMAKEAIEEEGRFCVALSGGSTPVGMYSLLVQKPFVERIDWSKVFFFWGDERCVPPDHPDSNYREAREALLDRLTAPLENIHRIPGEFEPVHAAQAYEQDLAAFFGVQDIPRFDLILLGMGSDGHTASLFPGSAALHERKHWAISVEHRFPPPPLVDRVTLTPIVLNNAAKIVFLVTGENKAGRLAQIFQEPYRPDKLPAQIVRAENGIVLWLVDQAAAAKIK